MTLNRTERVLNPYPLPPGPLPGDPIIPSPLGLLSVLPMPGLTTRRAAFALRRDASALLLNRRRDGTLRVAGSFRGPVGTLALHGDWALVTNGATSVVLRRE
jgi:hypothetical protein